MSSTLGEDSAEPRFHCILTFPGAVLAAGNQPLEPWLGRLGQGLPGPRGPQRVAELWGWPCGSLSASCARSGLPLARSVTACPAPPAPPLSSPPSGHRSVCAGAGGSCCEGRCRMQVLGALCSGFLQPPGLARVPRVAPALDFYVAALLLSNACAHPRPDMTPGTFQRWRPSPPCAGCR